jgi:peptidoglycan/LPS O-acetylase OafA/YrhL
MSPPPTAERATRGYMPHLDSVRAIAIGLVIVEHLGGPFVRIHFPLRAGALGVNLFFVLSGFLISGLLFTELDRTKDQTAATLGAFYVRRAARLIPAYFAVLAVLALANVFQIREDWPWYVAYASNFHMARGGPMLPYWSLAVEEQFYLLLPLLLLLVPPRHRLTMAIGLIASGFLLRCLASVAGLDPTTFEVSLPGKLEVLGCGVLLGVLCYRDGQRVFTWLSGPGGRVFGMAALAALLLELAIFYLCPIDGLARYLTFTLTSGVYLGWVVAAAARGISGPLRPVFSHPAVRYVGKISYTIYLTHAILPALLQLPAVVAVTGPLPLPAVAIASMLISVLVAGVSWFLLEWPVMQLTRHMLSAGARRDGVMRAT